MEQSNKPNTIKLPNGQEVLDLFNMTGNGQAAIVNLKVMQRIVKHLPEADFNSIRRNTIDMLEDAQSLEHMVSIMETEVAFHKTVNILQTIDLSEKPAEAKVGQPAQP